MGVFTPYIYPRDFAMTPDTDPPKTPEPKPGKSAESKPDAPVAKPAVKDKVKGSVLVLFGSELHTPTIARVMPRN